MLAKTASSSLSGLPASQCSACGGVRHARVGREAVCLFCRDVDSGSVDEWLTASYVGGVLRWQATSPPHDPANASAIIYVNDQIDWIEVSVAEGLPEWGWPDDPAEWPGEFSLRGSWYRRLDANLFAWLLERLRQVEELVFPDEFDSGFSSLQEMGLRAFQVGLLGGWAANPNEWPQGSDGDPWERCRELQSLIEHSDRVLARLSRRTAK